MNITHEQLFDQGSEVRISTPGEFHVAAMAFGVTVESKGAPPKGKLAAAIAEQRPDLSIVDTGYFSANAANGGRTASDYGKRKDVLRSERDAAIEKAHADYTDAVNALRAELGMSPLGERTQSTGDNYAVTATLPRMESDPDNDGDKRPKRNAKGDAVLFRTDPKTVVLTAAQIREHSDAGERGRFSEAQTLTAAAKVAGWIPVRFLENPEWHKALLRDVSVERTDSEPTVSA
jgi:hypothetical protein